MNESSEATGEIASLIKAARLDIQSRKQADLLDALNILKRLPVKAFETDEIFVSVIQLSKDAGLSLSQIAKRERVAISTVSRWLEQNSAPQNVRMRGLVAQSTIAHAIEFIEAQDQAKRPQASLQSILELIVQRMSAASIGLDT